MAKFNVKDIVVITDGDFKGQLFFVDKVNVGKTLETITCTAVSNNWGKRKFFFDNLCADVILRGNVSTEFLKDNFLIYQK